MRDFHFFDVSDIPGKDSLLDKKHQFTFDLIHDRRYIFSASKNKNAEFGTFIHNRSSTDPEYCLFDIYRINNWLLQF